MKPILVNKNQNPAENTLKPIPKVRKPLIGPGYKKERESFGPEGF